MIADPNKPYQTLESVILPQNALKSLYMLHVRDYGVGPTPVLVLRRGNSRPFDYEMTRFVNILRDGGVKVVIEVFGTELTLEQFEVGGAYAARNSRTVLEPAGKYNTISILHRMETEVAGMSETDPRYEFKLQQLLHQRAKLSSVVPQVDEATRKSDEGLKSIAEKVYNELIEDFTKKYSLEQIAQMDLPQLKKLSQVDGPSPAWDRTVSIWNTARALVKEKTPNEQPTTQDQGDVTTSSSPELDRVDPTPPQSPDGETLGREEHVNLLPTEGV